MPNQPFEPEYKYLVMLGESAWGLSCEKLFGTERLNRDDVKWRSAPGQRPWLAGMVKQKMCALLHVEELQQMLADGVDIEGH
jgi:purine-binding chemotaxis protein CheW